MNVKRAKRVMARRKDINNTVAFLDIDAGKSHFNLMYGRCPCIIRSRGSRGFWIMNRQRRMTTHECARFQGINKHFDLEKLRISNTTFGHAVGNAMSLPVVGKILKNLAYAAGLIAGSGVPF